MEITPQVAEHLAKDHVAWLTTVTDLGVPASNPVWFVADGDDLVIYSEPSSRKVHNIAQRPKVSLHFNSDEHGGNAVEIAGEASLTHGRNPSSLAPYLAKYESSITGELNTTVEAIDGTYNTEIRLRPTRVRVIA
jgi:PPOX class probable F420-dependent enzyme